MEQWTTSGAKITDSAVRAELRRVIEHEGPLIIEHRYYRGGCAPDRLIFNDGNELEAYLASRVRPGDDIWAWSFDRVCTDTAALAHGKVPDDQGRVPIGGPY